MQPAKLQGQDREANLFEVEARVGISPFLVALPELSDLYCIIEAPDNTSAAAVALAANAAGAARIKTTVLLTPEEVDQATRKSVTYHQPGQE